MSAPPRVPLGARLALAACGLAFALGLAEVAARLADGGALPQLALYTYADDGRIVLAAGAEARVRRPDGGVWRARTAAHGLRSAGDVAGAALGDGAAADDLREAAGLRGDGAVGGPSPGGGSGSRGAGAWLVVGDSQAFGSGVEDDETFAARLGAHNAGVPGYGLVDALAQAEALLPALRPAGVYVLVDQANDWDDGLAPLHERYVARGGWLLTPGRAEGPGGWAWGSPLARLHLFYLVQVHALATPDAPAAPAFLAPDPALTAAFAERLLAFSRAHPDVRTVPVWLPVDAATSEARAARTPFPIGGAAVWADTTLRDTLAAALSAGGLPLVDLTPALSDPASFLEEDFHLSVAGHAAVAARLAEAG